MSGSAKWVNILYPKSLMEKKSIFLVWAKGIFRFLQKNIRSEISTLLFCIPS